MLAEYLERSRSRCDGMIAAHYRAKGLRFRDELLHDEIGRYLRPGVTVLDAGCGSDAAVVSGHAGAGRIMVGVDRIDSFSAGHPVKTCCGDLESLPFGREQFDLIVSRSVLEHLENPRAVFREFQRVLKKAGVVIATTPNKYYYSSVVSAIFPDWLKRVYLRTFLFTNRLHYDNFPTHYRCNTIAAITRMVAATDFKLVKLIALRHYPYYFRFSPFLFRVGILYDELITALRLDGLQSGYLLVLQKP